MLSPKAIGIHQPVLPCRRSETTTKKIPPSYWLSISSPSSRRLQAPGRYRRERSLLLCLCASVVLVFLCLLFHCEFHSCSLFSSLFLIVFRSSFFTASFFLAVCVRVPCSLFFVVFLHGEFLPWTMCSCLFFFFPRLAPSWRISSVQFV